MTENEQLVRRYLTAVERFDVSAVADLLADGMVQQEMPNLLYPAGQKRDRARMLMDLPRGAAVLRSQRYEVVNIVASMDSVV